MSVGICHFNLANFNKDRVYNNGSEDWVQWIHVSGGKWQSLSAANISGVLAFV